MFDTDHHRAFEKWWQYASKNYVSWNDDQPVAVDLYYDPIVDEHVLHGAMGIISGLSVANKRARYLSTHIPDLLLVASSDTSRIW